MKREIHIRVPATTANLGPGFDCLGLALSLYHYLSVVEEEGEGLEIRALGELAGAVPLDADNLVYQAMVQIFSREGHAPGRLRL